MLSLIILIKGIMAILTVHYNNMINIKRRVLYDYNIYRWTKDLR
jgi:hypothetical protein